MGNSKIRRIKIEALLEPHIVTQDFVPQTQQSRLAAVYLFQFLLMQHPKVDVTLIPIVGAAHTPRQMESQVMCVCEREFRTNSPIQAIADCPSTRLIDP